MVIKIWFQSLILFACAPTCSWPSVTPSVLQLRASQQSLSIRSLPCKTIPVVFMIVGAVGLWHWLVQCTYTWSVEDGQLHRGYYWTYIIALSILVRWGSWVRVVQHKCILCATQTFRSFLLRSDTLYIEFRILMRYLEASVRGVASCNFVGEKNTHTQSSIDFWMNMMDLSSSSRKIDE